MLVSTPDRHSPQRGTKLLWVAVRRCILGTWGLLCGDIPAGAPLGPLVPLHNPQEVGEELWGDGWGELVNRQRGCGRGLRCDVVLCVKYMTWPCCAVLYRAVPALRAGRGPRGQPRTRPHSGRSLPRTQHGGRLPAQGAANHPQGANQVAKLPAEGRGLPGRWRLLAGG